MRCPCCPCEDLRPFPRYEKVTYWTCTGCQSIFTPQIPDSVLRLQNEAGAERNAEDTLIARYERITSRTLCLKMIDFGCGDGQFVRYLRLQGIVADGVDRKTKYQLSSADNHSVDAISSIESLEHVYHPRLLFKEFQRVLRPGGILYLETCPISAMPDPQTHPYINPEIGHCTIYSVLALRYLAETSGMCVDDQIDPTTFIFRRM